MTKKSRIYYVSLFMSFILHIFVFRIDWDNKKSSSNKLNLNKSKLSHAQFDKVQKFLVLTKKKNKILNHKFKKMQIVNNENNGEKKTPDKANFLSEKDQFFQKQTIAKMNGSFKKAGKGKLSGKEFQKESLPTGKMAGTESKKILKKEMVKKFAFKNKNFQMPSLSQLGVDTQNLVFKEKELEQTKILPNTDTNDVLGNENGDVNSIGLSRNNDYITDVPLGEMTNLNSKQFKYYGFYSRIRQKLEQFWGINLKEKIDLLYKSGRKIPTNQNYITSILVTLDKNGSIVKVQIVGTSGHHELDQTAIDSFNQAGPFPNPPKGMLIDGIATIEWGFVVRS